MSASATGKRWVLRDTEPFASDEPYGLLVRLLRLRGVTNRDESRPFLQPALPERFELPNMAEAVARLARALRQGERIAVFGDYDADGITATAVLVEGLTELGGDAIPYIPDRFAEGYGLNTTALRDLHARGVGLVVTVDTGTSAVAEVAYANERNLDVVVVDHHMPKALLPDAVAVVNPHLEGTSEDVRHLSGCGVAFALLASLSEAVGGSLDLVSYLDLVAIGAICDVVPLVGVNRALVAAGLRRIGQQKRPGLAALVETARLRGNVTADRVAFVIGPRINAAGRLDHGLKSYELLTTRDHDRAYALAATLERLNRERQLLTEEAVRICRDLARQECDGAPLVMVGHPEVGGGIAGLVAARLADEHYRPAIVYRRGPEFSVASARSVPGFDIHAALAQGGHLMERFGGHHQAGGFTVRSDRVEELRDLLTRWTAEQQDWSTAVPSIEIDLDVPLDAAPRADEFLKMVAQLEPCGQGNPAPVFLARGAKVLSSSLTADGRHLRLRLDGGPGRAPWQAIGFNLAACRPQPGARTDVVFQVQRDRYGQPQMLLLDLGA